MKYKATQKDRYGNMKSIEIQTEGQLEVPPMTSMIPQYEAVGGLAKNHPGEPKGTDTVPAWLTPGEFVVNKEATDMYGTLIKKINDEGRKVQDMKEPMYAKEGSSVEDRKIKIYKHLANEYGLPDNQVAAIMGQIAHESAGSFDPFKLEEGVPKHKQGEGLFQNTPGATRMLEPYNKYLQSLGINKKKMTEDQAIQTQLDFFMKSFMDFGTSGPVAQRTLPGKNPVTAHGYKKANKMKEAFADTNMRVPAVLTDDTPSLTGALTSFINVPGEALKARSDATEKMLKEINSGKYSDYKYQEDLGNMPTTMIGTLPQDPSEIPGGLMVSDIPRPDSDSQSLGGAAIGAVQKGMANTYDNIRKSITGMMPKFDDTEETKARFNKRRKEVSKKVNTNKSAEQAFNLDIGGLVPGIDFPSDPRDNEENFLKRMLGYDSRTSSPPPVTNPGFKDYGELIPRLPIDYEPQGTGGMPEMEKVDPTFQNILRQNTPPDVTIGEDDFTAKAMSEIPNEFSMMGNLSDLGQQYDSTTRTDMGNDNALTDAFAPPRIPDAFGMTDTDLGATLDETPMYGKPTYTSSYDKMVQDELGGSPAYEIPAPLNIDPDIYDQDTGDLLISPPSPEAKTETISYRPDEQVGMEADAFSKMNLPTDANLEAQLTEKKKILDMEMKYLTYYRDVEPDAEQLAFHRNIVNKLQKQIESLEIKKKVKKFGEFYTNRAEIEKQNKKEKAKVQSLKEVINDNEATQTEKNAAAEELAGMGVQTEAEKQKEIENEKLSKIASQVDTNLENAMTNDLGSEEGQAATTNASQNEPEVSKARQMFNFLFGDMIDGGELGRAIAVYLGSRALGYDHGSSIGYVAKQYLKRVDAQNAAWDKWTRENMTKFTPASMAKFKRTMNPGDLIPIGNPIRSTGKRETYYHPTLGKGQAFEFKVANASGDDTTFWSFDPSGKNQKLVVGAGWTSENILDVSTDEINLIEKMLTGFQNKFDKETTGSKAKGTERTMYYSSMGKVPGVVPAAAAAEVAQWLHERGIPPGKFKEPIAEAYKLLIEHNKERMAADKPDQIQSSLLPFLQESTVKLRLEDMSYIDDEGKKRLIPSPIKGKVGDEIRTMDTKVLMELEREISTFFPAGTEDRFWAQAAKAWMTDGDVRKEFEEAAKKKVNSDYTPFSLFAKVLIANELEKAANESTQ